MSQILMQKIRDKEAIIAVVGLGYVGLPMAIAIANAGYKVLGIDISEERIDTLNKGISYIIDIENEEIEKVINKMLFTCKDFSVLSSADVINICVPTPLDQLEKPDVSHVEDVINQLIKYMRNETLIILTSTTYPGTTEELIIQRIEEETHYKVGSDFFACFSPERINPGSVDFKTTNTPRVIGGATSICLDLGVALYSKFTEFIFPVRSLKVAEMSKLLENSFRFINITMINELALICDEMNINVWEVIEAASTKPYGFMPFFPGPGIGGHCIPVDPIYLLWKAKSYNIDCRFIELADQTNRKMSTYIVKKVLEILKTAEVVPIDAIVYVIGITYKKDIDDLRESPALEIMQQLMNNKIHVRYYDPYIDQIEIAGEILYAQYLDEDSIKEADVVLIVTEHSCINYDLIVRNGKIIYDTRNATRGIESNNIILLGGNR
ncbi:MAG: nucleotide sugar dehydrogenase [Anaerosolibacter sp.]|jgi:UDP-N-acetyl-D-glucosamine dehydrogenase|uniref:nucleotide sugar dehydrogenase n=1 Tax=Anaerosolibacter sp. TaxID=1872527 RepID=UPI0026130B65|nr:nucleotide sugar dehydrogenase [Anaerosolibacter sp.]MDF2546945.1 nucleotide sugar dehydrogenase [Anaerosolibacter sp.]